MMGERGVGHLEKVGDPQLIRVLISIVSAILWIQKSLSLRKLSNVKLKKDNIYPATSN